MSRLFAAITVLALVFVLAIPAFAHENPPAITNGTSNTIFVGFRSFILPHIEQDN